MFSTARAKPEIALLGKANMRAEFEQLLRPVLTAFLL
jgi:hypothetical protein